MSWSETLALPGIDRIVAKVLSAVLVVGSAVGVLLALREPGTLFLVEAPALLMGVFAGQTTGVFTQAAGFFGSLFVCHLCLLYRGVRWRWSVRSGPQLLCSRKKLRYLD